MPEKELPIESASGVAGFLTGKKRQLIIIAAIAVAVLFGVMAYTLYKHSSPVLSDVTQPDTASGTATETSQPAQIAIDTASNASAPAAPIQLSDDANYKSEHFHIGDVAIGGEAEFLLSEDGSGPLEISSIRGEAFTEKNKSEVKLVISWKTSKLAKSEIAYSKGVGQNTKTVSEDDYGFNHSVVIAGLDQASTYVYTIVSNDRFGNVVTSDSHAVYTGSRTVSLFDLIAGAIGEVFGWAINKN
jgi:hypothetical protein